MTGAADRDPRAVRPLIVVGFDGSEGAARAIAATTTLMAGAEVLVVCVYRSVLAAAGAALIVGTRGLSGLSRLVLGSVSSGLVHHATRPVLVVPDTHPGRRPDSDDHAPGRTLAGVLDRQAPHT